MVSFEYKITNGTGLHARPAGMLVKTAQSCTSKITVSGNGKSADATKLFAVLGLNTKSGDVISFSISGKDEEGDRRKIEAFCKENL
mgnify:CR=1 FL=1|jgi:phosphotransferase system HPr (HPr) family protein